MFAHLYQILLLVKPYKGRLALGILCGVLSGLASPLLMVTVKVVTEVVFPTGKAGEWIAKLDKMPGFIQAGASALVSHFPSADAPLSATGTVLVVCTIPLAMFLRGFFAYLNIYFMSWVSIRAVTGLRVRLFSHLVNLSLSFFHRTSTGELISRVNEIANIQNVISTSLSVIIREPITLLGLAAALIVQQPKLTLIALLVFPLCLVPSFVYGRRVRKSSAAFQQQTARMVELMHETFTANRIVKAYNLEQLVVDQFRKASQAFISFYMRITRACELPGPMIEFFGALGVAMFLLYIAFVTKQTPGDFLQFVGSIFLMYAPIKALARLHTQLETSRIVTDLVHQLLRTTSTVPEPAQPQPLRAAGAEIHFDRVSFNYEDKPVLRDINLTVKPGQVVALVGFSGSGKTTLTSLLLRFYDPREGAIRIGDTDIRQVAGQDLRNQIAVVTQETILFNDTIARNIELGRPGATRAEIIEAARHAHAYDFIMEKPQGFDTVVGEKGLCLSGGQRQRIALARAIVKNAPILILDEATSALDTEAERAVQADLDALMAGRTTLCIAHRLSTIQHADLIVVLDQGRIIETGTHLQLLEHGGLYKRLHELQYLPYGQA